MGNFRHDLKVGEQIEDEILIIIKKEFPSAYKETGQFHREYYDFLIPKEGKRPDIKIEVKADLFKSENLCFECLGREAKSTGIIKTSAQIWIHCRNGKYLVWRVAKLKRYLLNVGGFLRKCGDNWASAAWVIPEKKILEECPPEGIFDKNSVKLNRPIKDYANLLVSLSKM